MNSLKNYIKESLLNNVNDLVDDDVFINILTYIKDNYSVAPQDPKLFKMTKRNNIYIIDVDGNLRLDVNKSTITDGSFKFGHVTGYFDCSKTNISNLEGAPDIVDKFFDCGMCKNLESLEGGPSEVRGSFYSASMCPKLTSLKGGPEKTIGDFDCMNCKNLITLEGGPKYVGGNYQACNCSKLKNLSGVDTVKGYLDISRCKTLLSSRGSMIHVSKNINRIVS